MQRVGFIGAGKVATTMGRYLSDCGVPVTGYYDKDRQSADETATFTQTNSYESMEELVASSDIVFIATPDDVISSVWESLRDLDIAGKIVGIFSGSLSSDLYSGIDSTGAYGVSVHPMYAFSDKFSDHKQLHSTRFTIEGDEQAVETVRAMLEKLGHKVAVISSSDKMRYHAAASVASNLMIGLYDMSLSMLRDCGFSEEDAVDLLTPLIEKNTSAMLSTSPAEALTGPIERGDVQTVKHHLESMSDDDREIYIPLARRLVKIAKTKHPDRPYEDMQELLM